MVRHSTLQTYYIKNMFQSTHPSMVRRALFTINTCSTSFQSTHPSMVRHAPAVSTYPRSKGFNPRTQVWCDSSTRERCSTRMVSIHAPKYGATYKISPSSGSIAFQSTHPSMVRQWCGFKGVGIYRSFNPRTQVWCDAHKRSVRADY